MGVERCLARGEGAPRGTVSGMLLVMLAICAGKVAYAQNRPDLLQQLVELSAQRLVIAEQVALAKWDRGVSGEDPAREAQVISSAAKEWKGERLVSNNGVKLPQSTDRGQQARSVLTAENISFPETTR